MSSLFQQFQQPQQSQLAQLFRQQLLALNLPAHTQIVLGYSGGVDSEVMAYLLAEFCQHQLVKEKGYRYLLVHVHHGLSDNADHWAAHCQQRAQAYQLPIQVLRVQVKQGARLSLEAQARDARYAALNSVMQAGDVLLTAHHQDDQLETILLALKRGQGTKGLSGMGQVQVFAQDKQLVRPLLGVSKQAILDFAAREQLLHIEDESNQDTRFDRNFLRQQIVPQLLERWPQFAQTASRSAALCASEQQALNEVVQQRLATLLSAPIWGAALSQQGLATYSPTWQALLLRGYLEHCQLPMLSQVQLQQALAQLLSAKEDAKVLICAGGVILRRFADMIYASAEAKEKHATGLIACQLAQLQQQHHWQFGAFEFATVEQTTVAIDRQQLQRLSERHAQFQIGTMAQLGLTGGYRCQPHFRQQGRELKKCWVEAGVPPWLRPHWPLLMHHGQLIAAIGLWVEKPFLLADTEYQACHVSGLNWQLQRIGSHFIPSK